MKAFLKPIATLFHHKSHSNPKVQNSQETQEIASNTIAHDPDISQKVTHWLTALGGAANVSQVEACAQTRLRLILKESSRVDEDMLKNEGVGGVVWIDDHLMHLLIGLNADQYATQMRAQIS